MLSATDDGALTGGAVEDQGCRKYIQEEFAYVLLMGDIAAKLSEYPDSLLMNLSCMQPRVRRALSTPFLLKPKLIVHYHVADSSKPEWMDFVVWSSRKVITQKKFEDFDPWILVPQVRSYARIWFSKYPVLNHLLP